MIGHNNHQLIIIWEYDGWCRLGHGKHHHRLLTCYCWWKKSCTTGDVKNCTANNGMNCLSSWWFQPIWNILVKMGSSSPNRDENKKYLSCHQPATYRTYQLLQDMLGYRAPRGRSSHCKNRPPRRDFLDLSPILPVWHDTSGWRYSRMH